MTFVIRTKGDVLRAKALIELAYANARKVMIDGVVRSSLELQLQILLHIVARRMVALLLVEIEGQFIFGEHV